MEKVQLRQYNSSDQDAVLRLHINGLNQTSSFVDNLKYDQDLLNIKDTYLNNGGEFFVASLNNRIVGIGALKKIDSQTAEIKRMRVNKDYQRRGIGSHILDNLIKSARDLGYKKLMVDTSVNQIATQHLYQKRGFKECKRKLINGLECIFFTMDI